MRDLRGQALESKKTISKKARLRESIQTPHTPKSRSDPKRQIHNVFDKNFNKSNNNILTVTSGDDEDNSEPGANINESWTTEINSLIDEIIEIKGSTTLGRERALSRYSNILMNHYASEEIIGKTRNLFPALLKSIKRENNEKEVCNALLAITLTIVTVPSEVDYNSIERDLIHTYKNSKFNEVKAMAIQALSVIGPYSGASESEIDELMDELIAIVESDGNYIEASDNAEVVIAACKAWGHLATFLEDVESKTEIAIEAFMEQLNSSDVNVQITAGENIALLFECSYTEREADDGPAVKTYDDEGFVIDSSRVKRYEVYRQKDQLLHKLRRLANESSKHITKKDRKNLHSSFSDIINTVEFPTRGPRFQKAIDMETGRRYGSRVKVRLMDKNSLEIDKWWKMFRLKALREFLSGGISVHLQENEAIIDIADLMN